MRKKQNPNSLAGKAMAVVATIHLMFGGCTPSDRYQIINLQKLTPPEREFLDRESGKEMCGIGQAFADKYEHLKGRKYFSDKELIFLYREAMRDIREASAE